MIKIKDTSLAAVGTYYGTNKITNESQIENITNKSLKNIATVYCSIPLTIEHDSKQIVGYTDNLRVIQNMLIGDLNIYDDVDIKETCLSKFISPEFLLNDNNEPVSVIYASIVKDPAITENLPIITDKDLTVLNAKKNKKTPYRFQKNQKVEIADGDACEKCKKLSQKTRSKPITYAQAKSMLPLHPNCRCRIEKA